jgi:hypothetical protein
VNFCSTGGGGERGRECSSLKRRKVGKRQAFFFFLKKFLQLHRVSRFRVPRALSNL